MIDTPAQEAHPKPRKHFFFHVMPIERYVFGVRLYIDPWYRAALTVNTGRHAMIWEYGK